MVFPIHAETLPRIPFTFCVAPILILANTASHLEPKNQAHHHLLIKFFGAEIVSSQLPRGTRSLTLQPFFL
jgi:hypothetical protein